MIPTLIYKFYLFRPSSFIFLDYPLTILPVFAFSTVHCHLLRPSSFISLHRPVPSPWIDQSSPLWPSTLSLFDSPVWYIAVQFRSFGPFSWTLMDRPLWFKTVDIRFQMSNICFIGKRMKFQWQLIFKTQFACVIQAHLSQNSCSDAWKGSISGTSTIFYLIIHLQKSFFVF